MIMEGRNNDVEGGRDEGSMGGWNEKTTELKKE